MRNILVIGSINMDMVITADRMPLPGETITGGGFQTFPGGKGANQALAAAKLGSNVKMICRAGNDAYGESLIRTLNDNGVETPKDCIAQTNSGVALITVCGGDNSIIVSPGANAELTESVIDSNLDMIKWADILLLQFEIPMNTVIYAAKKAKENNCKVLVNPAPMSPIPLSLLQYTDIFIPNRNEAEQALGRDIKNISDGKTAVLEILKTGVSQAVITMGADGSVYNSGREVRHTAAFDVDVADTTAAGDSYIAGLCTGLCRGFSIDMAVTLATAASAITVGSLGASSSLPNTEQLKDFLIQRKLTSLCELFQIFEK